MTSSVPAVRAQAIDVSGGDQTLETACRGVYIGTGGNLVCRLSGDNADRTFTGLLAGATYPFQVKIIRQTNTTIANSLALF